MIDPNEENTDENLKIIEYLPPICESFLRYVLDIIILNPLHDIILSYDNNKQNGINPYQSDDRSIDFSKSTDLDKELFSWKCEVEWPCISGIYINTKY